MSSKSISTIRRELTSFLRKYLGEEATAAARIIVCDKLKMTFTQMVMHDNDILSKEEEESLWSMARRAANHEPIQYICEHAEFCGLDLHVEPGVLIPRPETEQLVDWICENYEGQSPSILDIGTGSGCIAIALDKRIDNATVSALDKSPDALRIAKANAEKNGSDILFLEQDIFNAKEIGTFDVVVSNPPYVLEDEKASMTADVLEHEPEMALFVPNDNPLLFYRQIANLCREGMLRRGGELYFEINERFGHETANMLREMGFSNVTLRQDYCAKDRMVRAALE